MTGSRPLALVTGGAGLIGSHLVDLLGAEGFRVRILDNLTHPTHAGGRPPWIPPEADFRHGDVKDPQTLADALEGVDYVFHQAAHGGFTPGAAAYFETNTVSAALILDLIAGRSPFAHPERPRVRKIVFASTQAVYGEGKYDCPAHGRVYPPPRSLERLEAGEWDPNCPRCGNAVTPAPVDEESINPYTPYAISKAAAETAFLRIGETYGLPVVGLRYALTYGPRQSLTNPFVGITSVFSTRLLGGREVVVYEDGRQTRDFIYVKDVARANLVVALDDRADGRVFNVGVGRAVTVTGFVDLLAGTLGVPSRWTLTGEFRPGEVRHLVTDATRLEALGWRAEVTLEDGLGRYASWIRDQGPTRDYLEEALPELRATGVVRPSQSRPDA